ncbi:MAG: flagellar biosynthetic protein FliO [Acidobacteriota bacterium]|jgi:flagellar biosynthetic protein FliO|nr:flagellar biosynthetic protein FliO [Acidobacteriota bacterium]
MKVILPVFLALCLGVVPVFCQDALIPDAETISAESAQSGIEAADASAPPVMPEVNAAATVADGETPLFGADVPQFSMLRAFSGLGLVLCLLIGAYFGVRKLAPGYFPFPRVSPAGKNLKIVESLSMGDRRSISLVEVGGRRFLVGSTPQQINLLTALSEHFSLVAEDSEAGVTAESPVKEEGEKHVFRNIFNRMGEKPATRRGDVLPDEIRQKMRRLREALENR